MGIVTGDIKLVASQAMSDADNGGGAPSPNVIPDGVSNAIFPDISELDRAGGRVNLRKVFPSIQTPSVDGYYGANMIVAEPPQDPRVSVTMFTTENTFDRRTEAASRMESYLAKGAGYSGTLFGNHISGQQVITILQRNEVPLPVVGSTYILAKNIGLPNAFDQYVRVTNVSSMVRTFSDPTGDFLRTQVQLTLSDPLQQDFNGFEANRFDTGMDFSGKTRIYDTVVADAARYFGVVKLDDAASIGDYDIKAEGIYTQLVPSTRIETPISDARMNQQSLALVKAGEPYVRTMTSVFSTAQSMFIGGGVLPATLSIVRGGVTITDKGGFMIDSAGNAIGSVDYENGIVSLSSNVFGTSAGAHTVTYTPAYAPTLVNESISLPVTSLSQRLSWTISLDPAPARGTLQVSYRALGAWYVLRDDGSGVLRGTDTTYGAGTINYTTGTATVTVGAMPDVGSAVIFTFVSAAITKPAAELTPSGPALPRAFGHVVALPEAVKPGTLVINWNDGTARSASDSAGVLTGDATGTVNYATGELIIRPTHLVPKYTSFSITIIEATERSQTIASFTDGGSTWTGTLPAPVRANSLQMALIGQYQPTGDDAWLGNVKYIRVRLFDDGAGNLKMGNIDSNITVGSINYSTGAVSISKTVTGFKTEVPDFQYAMTPNSGGGGFAKASLYKAGYKIVTLPLTFLNGPSGGITPPSAAWSWWTEDGSAAYTRYAGSDGSSRTLSFSVDSLFMPNNPDAFSSPYGASTKLSAFKMGGDFYVFNTAGSNWMVNPSPTNGVGTAVGVNAVVANVAGVLLDTWTAGLSPLVTEVSGATQPDISGQGTVNSVDRADFRTAVSPLVNGGFNIAGNWTTTGTSFSVTANSSGIINTGTAPADADSKGSLGIFGVVDYETGIVSLRFGYRVGANLVGGPRIIDISDLGIAGIQYIESAPVQADTLRYNAAGYSYLPLDPDILGLNPVRLPADGRVPIFRPGTFAVVGNTQTIGPTSVSNGQTINCARVRLSRVRVIGSNDVVINSGYTADLEAGTVTFTNVTGYAQPVRIEHRIEDMMLVRSVQINGQLSFTRPLTHAYPADTSYVSSALIIGDMQAYVPVLFDQATWNNAWSDAPSGSSATATFNDVQHPIVVTNLGALTERWAVVFTSTTAFNVIGEHTGVIAIGNTGTDCAPINPATGVPYFTIPAAGWGLGWATGNVLRFNTTGAIAPVWVARTILQGPETVTDDKFTLLIRGDVDRP